MQVEFSPTALRNIQNLPEKIAMACVEFIYGPLAENPRRVGKPLRGELTGQFSARRGTYRIVYEISDDVTDEPDATSAPRARGEGRRHRGPPDHPHRPSRRCLPQVGSDVDHRDAHHLRRPPAAAVMRRIGSEVATRGHELQPRPTASGRHDRVRHGGHEFRSAWSTGVAKTTAPPQRRRPGDSSDAPFRSSYFPSPAADAMPAHRVRGWTMPVQRPKVAVSARRSILADGFLFGGVGTLAITIVAVQSPSALIARSNQTNSRGASRLSRSSRLGHRSDQHGSARVIRPTGETRGVRGRAGSRRRP